MVKLTWKKFPSVTTGGKAYFYHAYLDGARSGSVVWNRRYQAYAIEVEGISKGSNHDLKTAKSIVKGVLIPK